MKLPTDIVTQHKIRDSKICSLWSKDGLTQEEIGLRFKITSSRVNQILYKNKHLVKIDKEYEKLKRLGVLRRLLKEHPELMGKKTTLDIVDQMRVETEGNKVEHTGTPQKVVIIREVVNSPATEQIQSRSISIIKE
jgi:predicted XRE-type DNA-binding protein